MNNDIHLHIIIPIIIVIVIAQIYFFLRARKLIVVFKRTLPKKSDFFTDNIYVSDDILGDLSPERIIGERGNYYYEKEGSSKITLIGCRSEVNGLSKEIIDSINTYLLRNKGAVSDFNMLKDIVNRYSDSIEEEIHTILPIPLYLGLIGTMFGIIIGVSFLDIGNIATDSNITKALMASVGWAMGASVVGLILTTINSGIFFKDAKNNAETSKNGFFTFVQVELLPILTNDAVSSIFSLQRNLAGFNEKFENSIFKFGSLLDKILISFENQIGIIHEIKELDIAAIAKFNITVLDKLKDSVTQLERFNASAKYFERFNGYLININSFVQAAENLNEKINLQLNRTSAIEGLVGNLNKTVELNVRTAEENRKFAEFVEGHFSEIEKSGQLLRVSLNRVHSSIDGSLELLEQQATKRTEAIRQIAINEDDLLQQQKIAALSLVSRTADYFDTLAKTVQQKVEAISQIYIDEKAELHSVFSEKFASVDNAANKMNDLKDVLVLYLKEIKQSMDNNQQQYSCIINKVQNQKESRQIVSITAPLEDSSKSQINKKESKFWDLAKKIAVIMIILCTTSLLFASIYFVVDKIQYNNTENRTMQQ